MFLLFQSVGTSLDCHDFSNMMDKYVHEDMYAEKCLVEREELDCQKFLCMLLK